MDFNTNFAEREKVDTLLFIAFVLSCFPVAGFAGALFLSVLFEIKFGFDIGLFLFYFLATIYFLVLAFMCNVACFRHDRRAAMVGAVMALISIQFLISILLFIGQSKQRDSDALYGDPWQCQCGKKEGLTTFPYRGMCFECAIIAKKEASKIIKDTNTFLESIEHGADTTKEELLSYLSKIETIQNNRNDYPMVKKGLFKQSNALLTLLCTADAENAELYRNKLSENEYRAADFKSDIENVKIAHRHNTTMRNIAILAIGAFTALVVAYIYFSDQYITSLFDTVNYYFDLINSL